jgi:DNA-binding NarL/FixJ family response regulator
MEKLPMETGKQKNSARRVLVVDADSATRLRVKEILQSVDDFTLAGDFSNADEALNHVLRLQPDLVLLGVRIPGFKDIEYIRQFKRILIGLKIIVTTATANVELLESSLLAEAESCLVKPITAGQCLATLKFAGHRQLDGDAKPLQPALNFSGVTSARKCLGLSQREVDVLQGLAEGLLYKEIAAKLGVSYSAVHKYQHRLFEKLRVSNRSEAITVWLHATVDKSGVTRVPNQL